MVNACFCCDRFSFFQYQARKRDKARNDARCTKARRPRTAWMDNIKTWIGLPVEESIIMTEDRDKWRKCVHGVANRRIEDG